MYHQRHASLYIDSDMWCDSSFSVSLVINTLGIWYIQHDFISFSTPIIHYQEAYTKVRFQSKSHLDKKGLMVAIQFAG
jgi:hypothetical protein